MDTHLILHQVTHSAYLEYLALGSQKINKLQKELAKLEDYIYENDRISIREFIKCALKIRNINRKCSAIMYTAEKIRASIAN